MRAFYLPLIGTNRMDLGWAALFACTIRPVSPGNRRLNASLPQVATKGRSVIATVRPATQAVAWGALDGFEEAVEERLGPIARRVALYPSPKPFIIRLGLNLIYPQYFWDRLKVWKQLEAVRTRNRPHRVVHARQFKQDY